MMKITVAQRRVLECAISDGGAFQLKGLDKRSFRRDVVQRLFDAGLLEVKACSNGYLEWHITVLGKETIRRLNAKEKTT